MEWTWIANRWVIMCALLYACAFLAPTVCFWFVFIYLIPLYYFVITHTDMSSYAYALQGFWWGGIFFMLHMHALIWMLFQNATVVSAFIVSSLLILYSATVGAVWFAVASRGAALVRSPAIRLLIWVVTTNLFIDVVDTLFFKFICLPRGYVFAYPLVPLAQHPLLLAAIHYCTPRLLVFCLCATPALLVYALVERNHKTGAVITAFLLTIPFLAGFIAQPKESIFFDDNDLNQLVYVQPPFYNKQMVPVAPVELACALNEQLSQAVRLFGQARCFLLPESTFPFPLDLHPDIRQLWSDNALFNAQNVTVIMASHHSEGDERKNTLFSLRGCRIMQTYDKKTCLPFAEHMPWPWYKSRFFSEFLLKDKKAFHKGCSASEPIRLTDQIVACPYICSDLFFDYPRADDRVHLLVWLVNDSWFTCAYYRHLMFLFAKLQAVVYNRPILYIAHEFGALLKPSGNHCYLPSVMIPKNVN